MSLFPLLVSLGLPTASALLLTPFPLTKLLIRDHPDCRQPGNKTSQIIPAAAFRHSTAMHGITFLPNLIGLLFCMFRPVYFFQTYLEMIEN